MRFVSIIGDSISTYEGFNPAGYSVFYNCQMQEKNHLNSVYDTWWAKVNQALNAYICVNNSYSGSRVAGLGFPAASSEIRTGALHTSHHTPDIILIYIGFNDFGHGTPIKAKGLRHFFTKDMLFFEDAYSKMLSRIKRNYPNSIIVCATLMRTYIAGVNYWSFPDQFAGIPFNEYNQAIRRICRKEGCYLADIAALNMQYETLDGSHPTNNGHTTLYQAWIPTLSELGLL